jgi:TatD DNase family protein
MAWIDSHCHLDFDVFLEQTDLYQQLRIAGCDGVLVPATQAQFFARVVTFSQNFTPDKSNFVQIALGLHPYFLARHQVSDLQFLDEQIGQHQPCAVGEIGLDFMLAIDTHKAQLFYFEEQILLAIKHKLPVIVHCRKAHDQLASLLRRLKFEFGGIIHGFSGSLVQAHKYLELGFVLGLGGALTYDRAQAMHKMVKALPAHAYVLETDSPDMPPAFARGEDNSPLNVPKIAACIAQLRQQPLGHIYAQSSKNFYGVIPLRDNLPKY